MKVVINRCFGGFGISTEALKELVKRNAACIESYTPKYYYGGENENYTRKDEWEVLWKKDFAGYKNIGDGMMVHPSGYNIFKDGLLYLLKDSWEKEVRTDKDLISVVETMGEESNSMFANLKIVEIPDGISWEIDEYDGIEKINETHNSWS